MKTIEEWINKEYGKAHILDIMRFQDYESLLSIMNDFSNQQIELAVDKTLSVFVSNEKDILEFRSLRTQILNEIKDR